ncbi:MAG TPA: hypothetical protein VMY42_17845, partial [Thermoguttaceae bacterium]|nr:hypothetical protein [Thermoguttaceae bacterium]
MENMRAKTEQEDASMKRMTAVLASILVICGAAAQAATVNVEGGLIVCIGAEALQSVADHWRKPGCIFHCLERSDDEVSDVRARIQAAGCYGKVSAARFDLERLPYIDNLVNLVIVESGIEVPDSEVQRVLAPYGVAIV